MIPILCLTNLAVAVLIAHHVSRREYNRAVFFGSLLVSCYLLLIFINTRHV